MFEYIKSFTLLVLNYELSGLFGANKYPYLFIAFEMLGDLIICQEKILCLLELEITCLPSNQFLLKFNWSAVP